MMARRQLLTSTVVVTVVAAAVFGAQLARLYSSPAPSLLHAVAIHAAWLSLGAAAGVLSLATALLHALLGVIAPARLRRYAVGVIPSLLVLEMAWLQFPSLHRFFWPLLLLPLVVGPLLARAQLGTRVSLAALLILGIAGAVAIGMPGRRMPRRTPNIVLIGLDGVDASHLSAYGYRRKTSPFLEELRPRSLIMENAYSNACCTLGATTALLTGRLPSRTHVIYPPQELLGQDEYLHLPALLRSVGYQTYQFTTLIYGDATTAGFRDAFIADNGRPVSVSTGWLPARLALPYLILRRFWWEALLGRDEPIAAGEAHEYLDQDKLEDTLQILERAKRPAFVHVHLMDPHGPKFPDVPQVFSKGTQSEWWLDDYYDDTIYATDLRLRWFFDRLQKSAAANRTVVVIYSDHGEKWNALERVPLIFYSPAYKWLEGSRSENVQLVDVAPTLLSLIGEEKPAWMADGKSLLAPVDPTRVILAPSAVSTGWQPDGYWRLTTPNTPFHGMVAFTAIACQRWVRFDLSTRQASSGFLVGHARQCDLPLHDLFRVVDRHLQETGHPPLGADLSKADLQLDL